MNLNKVTIAGRLTREPEKKYTSQGTAITDIGLAVNRYWKGEDGTKKEEVTFIDATAYGRVAEIIQEFLHKGSPVYIEGRLSLDSWTDKQTNQKRSRLRIVAENLQMLGSRDSDSGHASSASNQQPQRQPTPAPKLAAPSAARTHDFAEPPDFP
jgi:single-strand DNA-binding protein